MNRWFGILGTMALCLGTVPVLAQHHGYEVEIDNHTQQDLHVTCHDDETGEEDTADVHAGETTTLSVHGGEHVHIHCKAGDHRGRVFAEREFEFNHRRTFNTWALRGRRDHHHDDGH